jgi:hypothetical protein
MVRGGFEFLTFLWWRHPIGRRAIVNRRIGEADLPKMARNLFEQLRVISHLKQRISVVGNGNIDVGTKTSTRKIGQPTVERLSGSNGLPELRIDQPSSSQAERPKVCGAMTQQSGDSGWGTQSAPQKLLHLVGCRDPNVRPGLKLPATAKR